MPAYAIGHITIKNEQKWAQYRARVPATLVPWGGRLMLRAKRASVLAGEHRHTDVVVIEFPDQKSAQGWYASADYQALIPLREEAAEVDIVSFDA
jgi:uncharacterized protein (DUF1330 family)